MARRRKGRKGMGNEGAMASILMIMNHPRAEPRLRAAPSS